MDRPSRRNVLAAGGALGALGALGAATPAQAKSLWTWSPAGSVAGTGAGDDPQWVWDPEVDDLVGSLLDRGDVPRVNTLLKQWTKNGQALPDGLPSDLRGWIEEARTLPSWLDEDKLAAAADFNEKRGLYLGVIYGFVSGMMSTTIPREARAVYYSKGGADMRDRITKTAKLGYDVGTADAFKPDGELIVTCVKTRLAHAGVRNLLPKSPYWTKSQPDEKIPISQADMMVTWHSLPTSVNRTLKRWQVPVDPAEGEGYLHTWQLTGHMLGIRDEYIPKSWSEAESQAAQVLDPIVGPTPEGVKLADMLLNLAAFIDGAVISKHVLGALTRYTLGDQTAKWLNIPKEPIWDPVFQNLWEPFIQVREGLLSMEKAPGALQASYWMFDEVLRLGVLVLLSGAQFPISIQIPETNNPNY